MELTDLGHDKERRLVDPATIAVPVWFNRHQASLELDGELEDLERSVLAHSQLQAIAIRPISPATRAVYPDATYELVIGSKRLRVASRLQRPVVAEVYSSLTTAQAFTLMHAENEDRSSPNEMEIGISFREARNAGVATSYDDLIDLYGAGIFENRLSASKVSKMIRAAEIVDIDWLWELIASPRTLKMNPVYKLVVALEEPANVAIARSVCSAYKEQLGDGKRITGKALVKTINDRIAAATPEPELPESKVHTGSRGQTLVKGQKGLQFHVPRGALADVTAAQLMEMFQELVPMMLSDSDLNEAHHKQHSSDP